MASFGVPIWGEGQGSPEHKGKTHKKQKVKKVGQGKSYGYLRMRMRQVDAHPKVSDRKLSPGISSKD